MRLIADGVVDREGVDGPRRPHRLHLAPPDPDPHRRARRRPARPGPGQARADRPGPARDHRAGLRRRRVRRRLQQRPAVQRHDPRGLRRDADPAARPARRAARPGGTLQLRLAVRTPFAGPALLRFLATRAVPGVETAGDGRTPARLRLPARHRHRRLELDRPAETRAPRSCRRRSGSTDLRDLARRRRARTPAPRRRLRPGRRRRRASPATRCSGRWSALRPGCGCRATSTATSSRSAPSSASRSRVAGARTVAAPARRRSTASRSPRRPTGRADPPVPDAGARWPSSTPSRCRCRGPAAARWSRCAAALADGDVRARPRRRPRRRTPPRCWRSPASARGPPTTSRCGRSAHPDVFLPTDIGVRDAPAPARAATPPRRRRAGRALAPLALLRPAPPVAAPLAPIAPAADQRGH